MSDGSDRLTLTFSALADPTRRAMLARLARGETTVKELSKPFEISGPAVTKHLKILEKAGLISRSRDAQRRPCRIEAAALKEATEWMEGYRRFWEESLDRLEAYLETLKTSPKKPASKKEKRNVPQKK